MGLEFKYAEKSRKILYKEGSYRFNEVKSHFLRLFPFWIAGALAALAASLYAKLFAMVEDFSIVIFQNLHGFFIFIPPLCFVISYVLVEKLAPYANGSGIPQLMAAVELSDKKENTFIKSLLSLRIILVKIVSSLIGVLGGGSIGREGPTLQISGSIFYLIDKNWKYADPKTRHGFLLAGAASGLASAFNTPLGGIVYVIEELAKSQLSNFRTGVLHAVIFSGLISQLIMGSYLYFGYPNTGSFQFSMMGEIITLSLISGALVTAFAQSLKALVVFRSKRKSFLFRVAWAFFLGLAFALCIVYFDENSMGPGKKLLNELLFNNSLASASDVTARFLGTVLTYGSGGAGGIFAPTLSLGGSIASYFSQIFYYENSPIVVLVGMTAGLAALTHSPLTSFILILEMTDRRNVIFPLMIAAVIGHGISKFISKKSFYEFVFEGLFKTTEELKTSEPEAST